MNKPSILTAEEEKECRPNPDQFERYLPWACKQLQVEMKVVVTKIVQHEYVSVSALSERSRNKAKNKSKAIQSKIDVASEENKQDTVKLSLATQNLVNIFAVYDNSDNLVQIKFEKNRQIPRVIFKTIALIIKYQLYLTSVVINKGLDHFGVYELCKLLSVAHITEVCLDDTALKNANYHILLENSTVLRQLSLSRCSIDDHIIETIAATLVHPLPASKTLSILNLSSNRISDLGAKYLAEALRSNRHLCYLNLADNMISDDGAEIILNCLKEFPLVSDELMASKARLMKFLKDKNDLIGRMVKDLRSSEFEKRPVKRKTLRPASTATGKRKGVDQSSSIKSMPESKSLANLDAVLMEKAVVMAENMIGEFNDPFSRINTFVTDGIVQCYGNNMLAYLNLAYNNLTFITVKKLLDVLLLQKSYGRNPKGIINVSIEGNNMPVACKELWDIDEILEMGLMSNNAKLSMTKKRTVPKTVPRL
ncbi:uncharacterized protein LOC131851908 [Achroia grisella]|uniref:uncharacterized protein LOC131851908 n=1 Tax=Achroia grisella TaxID=688607 RepID=UPI0027D2835F|nr:uncharacterized protein LOC131851908 [Achroia grisella]